MSRLLTVVTVVAMRSPAPVSEVAPVLVTNEKVTVVELEHSSPDKGFSFFKYMLNKFA